MGLDIEKPKFASATTQVAEDFDNPSDYNAHRDGRKKPETSIYTHENTSVDQDLNGHEGTLVNPVMKRKSLASRLFKIGKVNLFSSLTRRIMFLNLVALTILLSSILYLNQFREGLIDAKIESLLTQGRIIASAIASSAEANPDAITLDPEKLLELQTGESLLPSFDSLDSLNNPIDADRVAPVLRALIRPTQTRARMYDPEGILILDSRHLYTGGQILRQSLLPPEDVPGFGDSRWLAMVLNNLLQDSNIPVYREITGPGTQYPEVASALTGSSKQIVRLTEKGELTVSVAVPIQRFRAVLGVLLLSTEGDGIDRIIAEERLAIMRIFLVAAIVTLLLSVLLASTIANPLRKLSEAAIRVKRGVKSRIEIPDFSARHDEIGDLSSSLGEMTDSLYQRIEAIESFAADVSHELKNPLTSLRSAVETLPLAKTDDTRNRLMEVIQHDVRRLDRLITDISDASRLDADLVRDYTEKVNFGLLLENVVSASQFIGKRQKAVTINFDINHKGSGRKGFHVAGHETRLGQVINNLIDNANSFAPENTGQVDITLSRTQSLIQMSIEDNGPGIEAENIDRIFERFYTDRSETDGFGQNSGLGLSISRQIVEAHGGKIHAENRPAPDTGARFIVTLPADDS